MRLEGVLAGKDKMSNQTAAAVATIVNAVNWERLGLDLQAIIEAGNQGKLGKPLTDWLASKSWEKGQIAQVTEPKPTPSILELVSTIVVNATTGKFLAKERFVINTKHNAPVKINYLGYNFMAWFLNGDGKTEDPITEKILRYDKLCKASVDGPIIEELGGEAKAETTLSEMFSLMEKHKRGEDGVLLKNGYANIFYIKDQNGVLRTVYVYWDDGGWLVGAASFEDTSRWRGGDQVFSSNSVLESSETLVPA
jgi:hypothetical protein